MHQHYTAIIPGRLNSWKTSCGNGNNNNVTNKTVRMNNIKKKILVRASRKNIRLSSKRVGFYVWSWKLIGGGNGKPLLEYATHLKNYMRGSIGQK